MCGAVAHVRYSPKSGHVQCSSRCLLSPIERGFLKPTDAASIAGGVDASDIRQQHLALLRLHDLDGTLRATDVDATAAHCACEQDMASGVLLPPFLPMLPTPAAAGGRHRRTRPRIWHTMRRFVVSLLRSLLRHRTPFPCAEARPTILRNLAQIPV